MTKVGVTGAAGLRRLARLRARCSPKDFEVVGGRRPLVRVGRRTSRRSSTTRAFSSRCSTARASGSCAAPSRAATRSSTSRRRRSRASAGTLSTLDVNAKGMEAACAVALSLDADLVFTSTSDVYGNGTPPYSEDGELVIGPPTTKRWAYAVSKMYDEHYGLALADENDLRITILRLFNAYGPRNHLSWWGGPVVTFIESLLDGEPMEIHGDGRQTRTFTHVRDTAAGIVRALERPEARGEVINLGGTETITILELATPGPGRARPAAGAAARRRFIPYESLPGKYQDVRHRIPDTAKARAAARLRGPDRPRRRAARDGRVAPGDPRGRRRRRCVARERASRRARRGHGYRPPERRRRIREGTATRCGSRATRAPRSPAPHARPARPSQSGGTTSGASGAAAPGSPRAARGSSPSTTFVPVGDGHGPLRVVAEREARDPERRRLLLDAARVGDDRRRARLQRQEARVRAAARRAGRARRPRRPTPDALACPRMHREHDRHLARDLLEPAQRLARSAALSSTSAGRCSVTST